jgi:hypothetical protein
MTTYYIKGVYGLQSVGAVTKTAEGAALVAQAYLKEGCTEVVITVVAS